jgi:hypothetical protein
MLDPYWTGSMLDKFTSAGVNPSKFEVLTPNIMIFVQEHHYTKFLKKSY